MALELKLCSRDDDLAPLVARINAADWDEDNAIEAYDAASLRTYLEQQDTVFLVCHQVHDATRTLAGMASGRFEHKPYGRGKWLYIDEVDTCVDCRQQGVGTALMQRLLQLAEESACEEVWLGAEKVNHVANKFYASLLPDAVDEVIGYTFELD